MDSQSRNGDSMSQRSKATARNIAACLFGELGSCEWLCFERVYAQRMKTRITKQHTQHSLVSMVELRVRQKTDPSPVYLLGDQIACTSEKRN